MLEKEKMDGFCRITLNPKDDISSNEKTLEEKNDTKNIITHDQINNNLELYHSKIQTIKVTINKIKHNQINNILEFYHSKKLPNEKPLEKQNCAEGRFQIHIGLT